MSNELTIMKELNQVMLSTENEFCSIARESQNDVVFAREIAFAKQILSENPYLAGIAMKNLPSLKTAIINCASMGLSLNTSSHQAYLIGRGGKNPKVCFDISYRGLITLGVLDGAIISAYSSIVYEGDVFELANEQERPIHKFDYFCAERRKRKMVGVYCVAQLTSGGVLVDVLTANDVEKARKCSSMMDGTVWKEWDVDMWKKTSLKHASKTWPRAGDKYSRLDKAINYLNIDNEEGITKNKINNADMLSNVLHGTPVNNRPDNDYIDAEVSEVVPENNEPPKEKTAAVLIDELVKENGLHDVLDMLLQAESVSDVNELSVEKKRILFSNLNRVAQKKSKGG